VAEDDSSRTGKPRRVRRLAQNLGISARRFWWPGRRQSPIRNATLHVFGELLLSLIKSFLRLRYPAILDRKLARANLRLRLLLDGVKGHALFTVDGSGSVTSWNHGAERIFGHTESDVIGQHFSRFFTPEDSGRRR
jgi:PAS domain-containing protein